MSGTHTLIRTKASLIYRKTNNLRADQLLPGHTSLESTVPYPGIDEDNALKLAEQIEVQGTPRSFSRVAATPVQVKYGQTAVYLMVTGR